MTESDAQRQARYDAIESAYPTMSLDEYRRRSRRSVLTGGAAALAGLAGWRWIQNGPEDRNIPAPLRDVHEANESLWRALHRTDKLAPTFDRDRSSMIRVNGRRGLDQPIDLATWSMSVRDEGTELASHTMDDILDLPKREMTVEHKCVEGWSHVVTWGGVRFTDFLEAHHPEKLTTPPGFVSMETPGGGYYVGVDWPSMLNPQTLLAYELQGEPLDQDHGAPLRLVTTLKYGIKQLKRIGTIEFTDIQPADYWGERGYDWYAGL